MEGKQATFHKHTPESTNCSTGTQCHRGRPCGGDSQKFTSSKKFCPGSKVSPLWGQMAKPGRLAIFLGRAEERSWCQTQPIGLPRDSGASSLRQGHWFGTADHVTHHPSLPSPPMHSWERSAAGRPGPGRGPGALTACSLCWQLVG